MKQVGGGYVFFSEDARREYGSRMRSKWPPGAGWGERPLNQDLATMDDNAGS